MGQSKKQRIQELERILVEERFESDVRLNGQKNELAALKAERDRQRRIAEHDAREAEREAERKRRADLSKGIVDLSKIKHDVGFDFDHDAEGGTVTIALHASATEAKILASYATERTKAVKLNLLDAGKIDAGTIKVGFVDRARISGECLVDSIMPDFIA